MKSLWQRIISQKPQWKPRTVMLCVGALLVLLIPTILALGSVYMEPPPPSQTQFSVTIYDDEHVWIGTENCSEDPQEGATVADILYRAVTDSQKADRTPFPVSEGTPLYVEAIRNGTSASYTFYFSMVKNASFYLDANGQCYLIPEAEAEAFLSTIYAESLYNRSEPPVLYTNVDVPVTPTFVSWYYRTTSDSYRRTESADTTDELLCYDFSAALAFSFSDEPDACTVRVMENGALIFEGTPDDLSTLSISADTSVRIHVEARWNEGDGVFCYGELSYDFDATIVDRALFSIDRDHLCPNEFLILTCRNIQTPSELILHSAADLTPTFYRVSDTTLCVIPYPNEPRTDSFSFRVTYGAAMQSFSVALTASQPAVTHSLSQNGSSMRQATSRMAENDLAALLKALPSPVGKDIYFQGNRQSPSEVGYTRVYRYGDTLVSSDSIVKVTAKCDYFAAPTEGAAVPTVAPGEVLATGLCEALGRYVIVNHGLGMYTVYAQLAIVDVHEGDILAIGQSVGKAGRGPLSDGEGFLLGCLLNGQWCRPDAALAERQIW